MTKVFPAEINSACEISAFVAECLDSYGINKNLSTEYQIVAEEIALKLIANAPNGTDLKVKTFSTYDTIQIMMTCDGSPVQLVAKDEHDYGGRIIEQFSNDISQEYSTGENKIVFSIAKSSRIRVNSQSFIAIGAAIGLTFLLFLILDPNQIKWLDDNIVAPLVLVFVKFLSAIASPVAFSSLSVFIVSIRLSTGKDHKMESVVTRYLLWAIIAIGIGYATAAVYNMIGGIEPLEDEFLLPEGTEVTGSTIAEFITNIAPNNILEAFTIINPIPMLMVAVIVGIAASTSFGTYGQPTRDFLYGANDLFARMLNIMYGVIPFFTFLAVLDTFMYYGISNWKYVLYVLVIVPICAVIPVAMVLGFYALVLRCSGISPTKFVKEYWDIIKENISIGSSVQALPYNNRVLSRKTRMNRTYLNELLNIGTISGMAGNCVVLTLFVCIMAYKTLGTLTAEQGLMIVVILMLTSVGAPNQPGSLIMCSILIMQYLGITEDFVSFVVFVEAVMGQVYSSINSIGDIVMVELASQKEKRTKQKAKEALSKA